MRIRPQNFHLGSRLEVCDRCGFEFRNDQLHKEWTGLSVCDGPGTNYCFEQRHPRDMIRGDSLRSPMWAPPVVPDVYVGDGPFAGGGVFYGGTVSSDNADTALSGGAFAANNQTATGGGS